MVKNRNRGLVQLILAIIIDIYLWAKVPSWEKMVLDVISGNPSPINIFGSYWIHIVDFLLRHWEFISILVLMESIYAIITNCNLVADSLNEIKNAF